MASILIVDDQLRFRRALTLALSARGHDVLEAASGPDAMDALNTHVPQLILLDWQMPGLDGIQTCRSIRAKFNVPIIVVTARKKSGRDQALAAGAVDYVTKPFELDQLLAHINSVLSG